MKDVVTSEEKWTVAKENRVRIPEKFFGNALELPHQNVGMDKGDRPCERVQGISIGEILERARKRVI